MPTLQKITNTLLETLRTNPKPVFHVSDKFLTWDNARKITDIHGLFCSYDTREGNFIFSRDRFDTAKLADTPTTLLVK